MQTQDHAPKALLYGAIGTGKSYSCGTLLEIPGMEIVYVHMDPGGVDSVYMYAEEHNHDIKRIHSIYVPIGTISWSRMASISRKITMSTFKAVAEQGQAGMEKKEYSAIADLYEKLSELKDDHTGEILGCADDLDPYKYVLVLDGLTHLSLACRHNAAGAAPIIDRGQFQIGMSLIEETITKINSAVPCMSIVLGHATIGTDTIEQTTAVMADVLGAKLAPKLGGLGFSEVIRNVVLIQP